MLLISAILIVGFLSQSNSLWVISIVATVICLFFVELWRRNLKLPPGPWGLPILGYYLFLGKEVASKLAKLSAKYGDVMCFRTIGGTPIIVLSRISIIKEILTSRAEEFDGRPLQSNFLSWIDDNKGIAQTEGTVWKEQRRFFLQTAKTLGFGKMESEPLIHDSVHVMIEDIHKHRGKSFDPTLDVSYMTSSVISTILFQKKFKKDDPSFHQVANELRKLVHVFVDSRIFIVGSIFEHILLKWSPAGRRAEETKRFLMAKGSEIVEEHVRTFNQRHTRDFVDEYLLQLNQFKEKEQNEKSSFTLDRLAAICIDMFIEGTESVSSAICSLLSGLSRHVDAQKKVQAELDLIIGDNRLASWSDRQNLPHTEALVYELFRMYQPFYVSTFYSNFEETTISGYRIPKRSIIVANYWTVNNDPIEFPNPGLFDLDRFLNPDGKRLKKNGPAPYGIGKRSCVGESLAQMEVFVTIAAMLQHFTIYPGAEEGHIKAIRREIPHSIVK